MSSITNGQGTWNIERDPRDAAIDALRTGIDVGLSHIDTAEMYGNGKAEEVVAAAIEGRKRDEVFLVSKVLPSNASYKGTLRACEASLKRMNVETMDCYLLHWRGGAQLEETFRAFEELEQSGKIKSFGVSNFDEGDLKEAVGLVGEGRIACNQVLYHLGQRSIEHAVIPYCAEQGIAVVAYSPYGQGSFRTSPTLETVAARHDATPRQVALAFLRRYDHVFTIPKAGQRAHVEENAGAAQVELTEHDISVIDAAYPVAPWQGLPTL